MVGSEPLTVADFLEWAPFGLGVMRSLYPDSELTVTCQVRITQR